MNPLQQLKERLQTVLNDDNQFAGYHEAISDGVYACNLSVIALDEWVNSWINVSIDSYTCEGDYQRGVAFVEEQWHKITGMF